MNEMKDIYICGLNYTDQFVPLQNTKGMHVDTVRISSNGDVLVLNDQNEIYLVTKEKEMKKMPNVPEAIHIGTSGTMHYAIVLDKESHRTEKNVAENIVLGPPRSLRTR